MRRAKPAGWYEDFRYRLRFEAPARRVYKSLRSTRTGKGPKVEIVYVLGVTVPEYPERRTVTIRLANFTKPFLVAVTVDGPTDSPHRYQGGRLCMWHPDDGPELQWQADDGFLVLIQYIRAHLFREAYWRDYDYWPGTEAPHNGPKEMA